MTCSTALYFAVNRADLTQNMLDKSLPEYCRNPYYRRLSVDGQKIILKFSPADVPADLFAKFYEPMTCAESEEFVVDDEEKFTVLTELI